MLKDGTLSGTFLLRNGPRFGKKAGNGKSGGGDPVGMLWLVRMTREPIRLRMWKSKAWLKTGKQRGKVGDLNEKTLFIGWSVPTFLTTNKLGIYPDIRGMVKKV
jgi:hypothetical protein